MSAAFITGSRAYGYPSEDSDIDLVVLVPDSRHRALLADMADNQHRSNRPDGEEYEETPENMSLQFGKLNLLVCATPTAHAVWLLGTKQLVNRYDDDDEDLEDNSRIRKRAVKLFTKLRERFLK